MGCGMLRPEIDGEVAKSRLSHAFARTAATNRQ
jgi:hypothetical protein